MGEWVIISSGEVVWVAGHPQEFFEETELEMKITGYHPEEANPYDLIMDDDGDLYQAVCDEKAILRKKIPKCNACNATKMYHDKEWRWVCPFCEIQE